MVTVAVMVTVMVAGAVMLVVMTVEAYCAPNTMMSKAELPNTHCLSSRPLGSIAGPVFQCAGQHGYDAVMS